MVNEPDEATRHHGKPDEPLTSSGDSTRHSLESHESTSSPSNQKKAADDLTTAATEPETVSSNSTSPPDRQDEASPPQDEESVGDLSQEVSSADSSAPETTEETAASHEDPHYHPDHYHPREPTDADTWDQEEEGGGPVKSFLEHLEDFRWTIIRCLAALLIAMVVCLVAGNKVVELLKEPLQKAQALSGKTDKPVVLFGAGTNVWAVNLETNQFGPIHFGTNIALKFNLVPIQVGTNVVLGLNPTPARLEEIPMQNRITLKNFGPISPFVVALKIALFGGIGLASPFLILFVGQFVFPALHKQEKKYVFRAVAIGSLLFCGGVLFCYFFMLQIALNAAVQFSLWMNFEADIWRAEDYIGFVVKFMVGMGLSFELPVVLLTMVKLGLIDYTTLSKYRPYWVVVNMVLAAILTPPDVVSQLLMAIPLQILYEISVLIAWYWHRQDLKRMQKVEAGIVKRR